MSSLVFSALAAASFLGTALLLFPRRAKAVETMSTPTGVLIYDKEKALVGYTLISPMQSTSSYLLDMEGNVVHEWKSAGLPGLYAELLPNGNLLRGIRYEKKVPFGGVSGGLQDIDWDGNVVWEYTIRDVIREKCMEEVKRIMIAAVSRKPVGAEILAARHGPEAHKRMSAIGG